MGYCRTGTISKHGMNSLLLMTLQVIYQRNQAPMYYRGANAALLLYDITNAATFEDVRGWLAGA